MDCDLTQTFTLKSLSIFFSNLIIQKSLDQFIYTYNDTSVWATVTHSCSQAIIISFFVQYLLWVFQKPCFTPISVCYLQKNFFNSLDEICQIFTLNHHPSRSIFHRNENEYILINKNYNRNEYCNKIKWMDWLIRNCIQYL